MNEFVDGVWPTRLIEQAYNEHAWIRLDDKSQNGPEGVYRDFKKRESINVQMQLEFSSIAGGFVFEDILIPSWIQKQTKFSPVIEFTWEGRGVCGSVRTSLETSNRNMRNPRNRNFTRCTFMDASTAVHLAALLANMGSCTGRMGAAYSSSKRRLPFKK